jgi:hypothetical protein
MAKLPPLSVEQYETIRRHNEALFQAAVEALVKFRSIPAVKRNAWVKSNIEYWVNVKQALRWSSQIALQRCPELSYADRPAV